MSRRRFPMNGVEAVGLALVLPPQTGPNDPVAQVQDVLRAALEGSGSCGPQRTNRSAGAQTTTGRGGARIR